MDEIAARSRSRWKRDSVPALAVQSGALRRCNRGLARASGPADDRYTGSLASDIDAVIAAVSDFDEAATQQMAVFVGLVSAVSRNPELSQALTDDLLARPRHLIRDVLDRAVARGEIAADCELDLVPDILLGLNIQRILAGKTPDRERRPSA